MMPFSPYLRNRMVYPVVFTAAAGIALLICIAAGLRAGAIEAAATSFFVKTALVLAGSAFLAASGLMWIMSRQIRSQQAELDRQKEQYQNLFELVPCEIAVLDRNFRLIDFNHRFAEKFNPAVGEYCFHAYKGRNQKCEACPVEKTFSDNQPHFSEESGYTKDGRLAYWMVATAPQKGETGEVTAAMEMTVDLTDLKQLEDKLRKSEKKYKDIFNNIANPIFVIDREDFTILDCNNSVSAVYGYSKDEICGSSFLDLFMPADRRIYEAKMKTDPEIHRARHLRKTEKALFVNIRISPSEYDGKMVYLVTSSDITQRLEAEQQLIQASKMATLGEMATGVAHELNQPLSVIKTASSYLMKKIEKKSAIDEQTLYTMASEIDSHIHRATRVIHHMREFGRKSDISADTIHVNPVIEKALEFFAQQLKIRGIEVVLDLAPDLSAVRADASKLEQVMINLLVNARDAIEDRFGQRPADVSENEKKIFLRSRAESRAVIVEVEDTGTGIPDELIDKIFEPFFTTKEAGKGTGLGLSISYSIIKEWGAAISAEPRRSEGARFIIRFPVPKTESRDRAK